MRRSLTQCGALAVVCVMFGGLIAQAAVDSPLPDNGDFENGSTTGWTAKNATLTVTSPGANGSSYAADVAWSSGSTYSLATASPPVTATVAGAVYRAAGLVRSTDAAGKSICLALKETTTAGKGIRTASSCTKMKSGWGALNAATLTAVNAGDSVTYTLTRNNVSGAETFDVDNLTLASDTTPPTQPQGVNATAGSQNQVTVSWQPSTDPDDATVFYNVFRNGSSSPLATGLTTASYTDNTVTASTAYSYQVAAYDAAGLVSPPSDPVSVTTPDPATISTWNMDETDGTTMNDSVGSNTGSLVGSVAPGYPGHTGAGADLSYRFLGSASHGYVDVPNNGSLNPGSANLTYSAWINTSSVPSVGDYDVIRKGAAGTDSGQYYKMEILQSGAPYCGIHGSNSKARNVTGSANVADGSWHQVTCIKTYSKVQVLVDGTVVGTTSGIAGNIANSGDFYIGSHPGSDWYKGYIDGISVSFG